MTGPEESVFEVAGNRVPPGRKRSFEIPVAKLPTGSEMALPVLVVNGGRQGPCVWVSGAIHGDELNGVEVIRRVLERIDPAELAGVLLAIPIVNVFGFINGSRYLPDRRDLNRSFPGSLRGSLASRIANIFMREIVRRCSHGIDLHTGSSGRTNLPQIRADLDDPETLRCALAFGASACLHSRVRDGSLREAAKRAGAHTLVYEAGETSRFDAWAIEAGVRGVLSVLAELGMLAPSFRHVPPATPFLARSSRWVRAGGGGIAHLDVELGQEVGEGTSLGTITDTFGRRTGRLRTPFGGLVIGLATSPLVHRGDAVVHLARR